MSVEVAPVSLFKPASIKPTPVAIIPSISTLPINLLQCNKAVVALLDHSAKVQAKREETDLLGESEEKVFLVVGLKRAAVREIHMPIRLPLAHPVIDPKSSPVTLFVKDPQRTYKDLMESSKINFISRVVGLDKLRNKHKTFEAKRILLKEGELFLVDDRVVLEVGKALGKSWREAKKQPVPVSLARKDLKGELERAVASTYLQINTGNSLSVKFGTTSLHSTTQLVENLLSLIPQLAVRLPHGGFSNIQSLHIKTSTSTSLPIYSASLNSLFDGPNAAEVAAIEGKKAEKDLLVKAKEEKIALKETRRLERESEKEKREEKMKLDADAAKVEKKLKRKAAREELLKGEEEIDIEAEIIQEEEIVEPVAKKSKKSKKVDAEVLEEVVVPVVKEKKEKKSKKVKA